MEPKNRESVTVTYAMATPLIIMGVAYLIGDLMGSTYKSSYDEFSKKTPILVPDGVMLLLSSSVMGVILGTILSSGLEVGEAVIGRETGLGFFEKILYTAPAIAVGTIIRNADQFRR